jgi:hypothetical protein
MNSNLRNTIVSAVLALTTLIPMAARADHDDWQRPCDTHPANSVPPGQPSNPGHYETRMVRQWVPGFYESVFVPGVCETRHHGHHGRHKTRCSPGRYEQVYRDGHYESVAQQVWVQDHSYPPAPPRPVYSRHYDPYAGGTFTATAGNPNVRISVGGTF